MYDGFVHFVFWRVSIDGLASTVPGWGVDDIVMDVGLWCWEDLSYETTGTGL